ncbi:coiled-coil domain-containing protein 192 [Mesoplodon densirostris]|uniref:coiled-coil domain-containing protein 192 n=1 Tax=Mesoplodon densirostris TaxID=48708 RepID=UPI0028DC6E42|nr:coiled-coil domain-containing protein 192 [Mesoplodon densirostris]
MNKITCSHIYYWQPFYAHEESKPSEEANTVDIRMPCRHHPTPRPPPCPLLRCLATGLGKRTFSGALILVSVLSRMQGRYLFKGVTVTASQHEGPLYLVQSPSLTAEPSINQQLFIELLLNAQCSAQSSLCVQKESLETRQMAFTLAQLEALEICLKEAEEKAKVLSEQLAASEGTKSKLLEQVSWLEKKLEALDQKEDSGEPYEKMVLEKDQCIEKLQAEVKASQQQLVDYKLKHQRKLEKLQTDLATAKQEAAITVLELNEKIKTLCEGKPAPREDSSLEECYGGLPPVEEGDRKINLIVELSTQVSHQTEKITQLEEILEEKERKIQQLEAEREAHPFPEVKDSPECLQEAPIFFSNSVTPVVYDEDI